MSHANLVVLINSASAADIKAEFPDHHVYTDADLFSILNGDVRFFSDLYNQGDIQKVCEVIEKNSIKFPILIHTFNPLIINYLEAYADDKFCMILSKKRFYLANNENKFIRILEIPEFTKKIDTLCVGEAVCDSYLSKYM
jgi:hypothetical protein